MNYNVNNWELDVCWRACDPEDENHCSQVLLMCLIDIPHVPVSDMFNTGVLVIQSMLWISLGHKSERILPSIVVFRMSPNYSLLTD